MRLQEWIDNKTSELMGQKYKKAQVKSAKEIRIARHSISYDLFGAKDVALDAEVKDVARDDLPDTRDYNKYLPGVQVCFEVLKPRKRKTEREYFYVLIV